MILWEMFANKLKYLENEILAFKTAHFKTATTLSVMSKNSSVGFDLALVGDPNWGQEVISNKVAVVTLTTQDNTNMVGALYINGNVASANNQRYVFCNRVASNAGQSKYEVYVYSQNYNDLVTLQGGGSIHLDFNIQAVGTSRFNIAVSYINQRS